MLVSRMAAPVAQGSGFPIQPRGVGHDQPDQQDQFQAGQQPPGLQYQLVGQRHLQGDGDHDRCGDGPATFPPGGAEPGGYMHLMGRLTRPGHALGRGMRKPGR